MPLSGTLVCDMKSNTWSRARCRIESTAGEEEEKGREERCEKNSGEEKRGERNSERDERRREKERGRKNRGEFESGKSG